MNKSAENNKVLSEKWSVRQDGTAFDIMDESGAFATCDNEAKAYLIASAPELLEACEAMMEAWENNAGLRDVISFNTAFQKAHKAIAKSEGRA